jgi:hypothetical protein
LRIDKAVSKQTHRLPKHQPDRMSVGGINVSQSPIETRSITDEFQICMRLIAFKTLKVHVDGPGLTLFGVLE